MRKYAARKCVLVIPITSAHVSSLNVHQTRSTQLESSIYRIDERSSDAECSLLNLIKRAPAHTAAPCTEVLQLIVKVPLISAMKLFNTSQ